jgi:hypothetical protein
MNSIGPPENGRRDENEEKTNQTSPSPIDRVTHDILNQLSIICLCCCELRHSVAENFSPLSSTNLEGSKPPSKSQRD